MDKKSLIKRIKSIIPIVSFILGGVTLNQIIAFFSKVSKQISYLNTLIIELPFSLLIIILPLFLYTLTMEILRIVNIYKKPSYTGINTIKHENWYLSWGYDHKYKVINIRPICKKHNCDLINHPIVSSKIYCPICGKDKVYPYFLGADYEAAKTKIDYELNIKK